MYITILGCGGSDGVPQIGCKCHVCKSNNQYNKRTRSSILITKNHYNILIDVGPDFKQQALREHITSIDTILMTHAHFDHIAGIGDLRLLNKKPIPFYADKITMQLIQKSFEYAFQSNNEYSALLKSYIFDEQFSLMHSKLNIIPFKQQHGKFFSYGFRINDFAYSTDVSKLDDVAYDILKDINVWIIDCVRYYQSLTHFCLDDMLQAVLRVQPKKVILTHMSHEIEYITLTQILPDEICLAYDGMKIYI